MSRTTELVDENSLAALRFLTALVCGASSPVIEQYFLAARASGATAKIAELSARFSIEPLVSRFLSTRPDALRDEDIRSVIVAALRNARWRDAAVALFSELVATPELAPTLPILVKGAALRVGGWYGDERYFVDADVVVAERDVERWIAAASRIGADVRRGTADAYEAAYISDARGGLVEVHIALAGAAGSESGPSYEDLVQRTTRVPLAGREIAIPLPGVAREIAVHHFVLHHFGEPLHALRALEDLAILEPEPDESSLDWGAESPRGSVAKLRRIVRQVRADDQEAVRPFLVALAGILANEDPGTHFADSVDVWIESRRNSGRSAPLLVLQRIFPPWSDVRIENEPVWKTATRYVARPTRLLRRYISARRHRTLALEESAARWRATLRE